MIELDKPCVDVIDVNNDNYHPMYEDLDGISNGRDNIRYGFPGNGLPKWKCFDDLPELQAFPKKFVPILMEYWGKQKSIVFNYQTQFIFLNLERPMKTFHSWHMLI